MTRRCPHLRVTLVASLVVIGACGGRSPLDPGGSIGGGVGGSDGPHGASSGGMSGSGGVGGSGSMSSTGGSSSSSSGSFGGSSSGSDGGLFGGSSGAGAEAGAPGSAPGCGFMGPGLPQTGMACSNVGSTCIRPSGGDCRGIECDCDPPGTLHCYAINCYDAGIPSRSDAGLVDASGPGCPPEQTGLGAPCLVQGLLCTYSNGCETSCLCAGAEWVCATKSPCSGP